MARETALLSGLQQTTAASGIFTTQSVESKLSRLRESLALVAGSHSALEETSHTTSACHFG